MKIKNIAAIVAAVAIITYGNAIVNDWKIAMFVAPFFIGAALMAMTHD